MIKTVCKSYRVTSGVCFPRIRHAMETLSMAMRKKVFRALLGVCTKFELSFST